MQQSIETNKGTFYGGTPLKLVPPNKVGLRENLPKGCRKIYYVALIREEDLYYPIHPWPSNRQSGHTLSYVHIEAQGGLFDSVKEFIDFNNK